MIKRTLNSIFPQLAALALGSTLALACGDPANMTHVGTVAVVDGQAKTMVIVDAQTGRNLTFQLNDAQVGSVSARDRVVIQYTEQDGVLVAEDIAQG
jgi:hypothetical protein